MGVPEHAFNINTNDIFSPWSNPSSKVNNSNTDISIQIFSKNGNYITVKIFYTNNSALELPPSKPQFLRTSTDNNFVVLNWEPNIEPDMYPNGKYKIYRGFTSNNQPPLNYSLVSTINAFVNGIPISSWIDEDVFAGTGSNKLFYRITAIDNNNLQSVPSDWDWVYWDKQLQKENNHYGNLDYKLYQNYPNPFNPVTNIKYELKENSFVELKIFDVLGNELATLVNQYMPAGSHTINFNASGLPSGIYIYKIIASDFTDVKKLIIIK